MWSVRSLQRGLSSEPGPSVRLSFITGTVQLVHQPVIPSPILSPPKPATPRIPPPPAHHPAVRPRRESRRMERGCRLDNGWLRAVRLSEGKITSSITSSIRGLLAGPAGFHCDVSDFMILLEFNLHLILCNVIKKTCCRLLGNDRILTLWDYLGSLSSFFFLSSLPARSPLLGGGVTNDDAAERAEPSPQPVSIV